VADALPLFRHGLLAVLAHAFAGYALHEAACPDELLALIGQQRPTLVLLAANLTPTAATLLALLQRLRQLHAPVGIVVFVDPATGDELAGLRLLHQKVNCLLTRAAAPAEVCDSIRAVLQRGQHYSEHMLARLLQAPAPPPRPHATGGFSARQLEVLRLVAEDLSNEEIADCLCTSVRTVEYHRSQMLHKMGLRTTLGLVLFAQRQGLLPAPVGARAGAS
jgi:DNA-binding NarL/FixJ family response regulator